MQISLSNSLPIPCIGPSLSRGHQTVTRTILNIYYFKCLGFLKELKVRRTFCHPIFVTCLSPINLVNGLLVVRSGSCVGYEMLWTRRKSLVRRIGTLKSMQVNVSKSVTKMTKGGVDIQTDQIHRQQTSRCLEQVTWLQWINERQVILTLLWLLRLTTKKFLN